MPKPYAEFLDTELEEVLEPTTEEVSDTTEEDQYDEPEEVEVGDEEIPTEEVEQEAMELIETELAKKSDDEFLELINHIPMDGEQVTEQAPKEEPEQKEEPKGKEETKPEVNINDAYEKIMAPFKANGKEIKLNSPDEVISLMQKGANYTAKMQDLAAHKRTILMLEKSGLTNEDDLSLLIGLYKKDPEAIKKYFKDTQLDPFDIDTTSEVNYNPAIHKIPESEVETRTILGDLKSTPEGLSTIKTISDSWDEESINFAWQNPECFNVIHEQRESGVYKEITEEIERQTTIGTLPENLPFLEKYNRVGNQLFGSNTDTTQQATEERPIETRVQRPTSSNGNSERAKAASPTRATKRSSLVIDDLANLDDDAFLKQMNGRL